MSDKSSGKRRNSKAAAARDPKPGARNRAGFDLGGAVGDAKPRKVNQVESSRAGKMTADLRIARLGRSRTSKSAVAGVRDWLRNK